ARTVDIDRGRQDVVEKFRAGTLTMTMANFEDRYSGWPPSSVWADAGRYRTDVPIRVNMVVPEPGGFNVVYRLFTGTTDAVSDSWPGPGIDAQVTVTASDGFKKLARFDSPGLGKDANGNDVLVGALERTGTRIGRWADLASYTGARALDAGVSLMEGDD